jgi:hypothetical protein
MLKNLKNYDTFLLSIIIGVGMISSGKVLDPIIFKLQKSTLIE